MYVPHNGEKITHLYISKHDSTRKNRVILLMITDGEKWYYLFVKNPSAIFREITSKHDGCSYCSNCLHSFRSKKHAYVCKNHEYCYIEMPEEEKIY